MIFESSDRADLPCKHCGTEIDLESYRRLELCEQCEAIELEIRLVGHVPVEWLDGYE